MGRIVAKPWLEPVAKENLCVIGNRVQHCDNSIRVESFELSRGWILSVFCWNLHNYEMNFDKATISLST